MPSKMIIFEDHRVLENGLKLHGKNYIDLVLSTNCYDQMEPADMTVVMRPTVFRAGP